MEKQSGPDYFCWAILALFLLTAPISFGQSTQLRHRIGLSSSAFSSIGPTVKLAREYARLIGKLRAQGAAVKPTNERVRQPFFSVPGRIINVNDEGLQVFAYASNSATNREARRVSADGMTVGNTKPSWMAPPHFFKSGKLIVIYVGENQTILRILQVTLGDQFAGGRVKPVAYFSSP